MSSRKQYLLNTLSIYIVTIVFNKADGTVRTLRGTRNFTDIPVSMYPKQTAMPRVNEDIIRVFDLDQCQWRSFNFDSVIEYSWTESDGRQFYCEGNDKELIYE